MHSFIAVLSRLSVVLAVLLASPLSHAIKDLGPGNYRLPDDRLFWIQYGHACSWPDEATLRRLSSHPIEDVSFEDAEGHIIDGYCEGLSGPPLPQVIAPINSRGDIPCRYFVATDRLTPTINNGDFSNMTVWIMDENRYAIPAEAFRWQDTHVVAHGLKSNDKHVRRSVPVVSNWFELLPRDNELPLFSLYGFTRWKSYLLPKFKATKINPVYFPNWKPVKVVPNFKGFQDVAERIAKGTSYSMHFRVLRLCAASSDDLYPEYELKFPNRKAAPSEQKK